MTDRERILATLLRELDGRAGAALLRSSLERAYDAGAASTAYELGVKAAPAMLSASVRSAGLEELVRWMAQTVHQARHQVGEDGAKSWQECTRGFCSSARRGLALNEAEPTRSEELGQTSPTKRRRTPTGPANTLKNAAAELEGIRDDIAGALADGVGVTRGTRAYHCIVGAVMEAVEAGRAVGAREEREVCAAIAEAVVECFNEHPDDCTCTGVGRPVASDIAGAIRARGGTR